MQGFLDSQSIGTVFAVDLGSFSISLAAKHLAESKAFYEAPVFSVFRANREQSWLIMKNGATLIGLFQGMFDKNLLSFSPGCQSHLPSGAFMQRRGVLS